MRVLAETESEAERIVTVIWQVLERMKLPSPTLTVSSQSPTLIIDFHFAQQHHEQLLREGLSLAIGA